MSCSCEIEKDPDGSFRCIFCRTEYVPKPPPHPMTDLCKHTFGHGPYCGKCSKHVSECNLPKPSDWIRERELQLLNEAKLSDSHLGESLLRIGLKHRAILDYLDTHP